MQEHCHTKLLATRCSPFAIRHSLLAAVLTFASRYSLPFPDLPICRPADLPIRFGSAGASPSHFLPSRKVIHQSLIANRHSLFAIRYLLSFRLGRSLALPLSRLSSCALFLSRCLRKRSLLKQAGKNWRAHLLMRRKFFGSAGALPSRKLAIRHSLLATRCFKGMGCEICQRL